MPKYHWDISQGSDEWIQVRMGRVTASELGQIVTPEFKIRTGEMPKSYLAAKLAEAWRGQPLPGFSGSWSTDQGELREEDARKWAVFELDLDIRNCGFVEHDSGRFGASPDGLIGEDGGVEIKSPESVNHVKYLMAGEVPRDYLAQVHGCLYATGRQWWKFISFRRKFPALVITVERDEKICGQIDTALQGFYKAFDESFERLNQMNGSRKMNPFHVYHPR